MAQTEESSGEFLDKLLKSREDIDSREGYQVNFMFNQFSNSLVPRPHVVFGAPVLDLTVFQKS